MNLAIGYNIMCCLIIIAMVTDPNFTTRFSYEQVESYFNITNLLVAWGVIGVCYRLDTLIKIRKDDNK